MGTVGNSVAPTFGWHFTGVNSFNVHTIYVTMPEGGQITSVSNYVSADSGTSTFRGVIWDAGGNLLAQTADWTSGAGSRTGGGQSWHTANLTSPIVVAKNVQLFIGWWRHASQNEVWSVASTGAGQWQTQAGDTAPGTFGASNQSSPNGDIGAYATYTPTGVGRRKSGAIVQSALYRRKSGALVLCTLYRRKSGVLVLCS